jgi:two-component system osmolarity sensor histidine kinase EnvZ
MERIVDQCLDFLRSEEETSSPPVPLPIADVISDAVARHRDLGRPVDMVASDDAAACSVAIGRMPLQRLLDNLIENALHYGAPPVEIALSLVPPGMLRMEVRDHGPGIASAERRRVFEPFTQIDSARGTRGSCGLGLAIVRRIVDSAGGTVSLGEASGGGLLVTLDFPVAASV